MVLRRLLATLAAATALVVPTLTLAQQGVDSRVFIPGQGQGTVTLFERPNFGGAAITFRQTENQARVPFTVRSIIAEGGWRVCSDNNGRGSCVWTDRRYPDAFRDPGVNFTVRSVVPQNGGGGGWNGPVGGQSLRGIASQYWPAPEVNRQRVESCPGSNNGSNNCAAQTAERFCNFAGWRRAMFFQQATVSRRNVLSDVLCTNR